jgi:hypothetical protein
MTPETSNAILAVGTVIIAVSALAALCLKFWTVPKPVEAKLAILYGLLELTAAAALFMACYFALATDKGTLASLCALYTFIVRITLFTASSRSPAARAEILAVVLAALFLATVPIYVTLETYLKLETGIVESESRIVSILERIPGIPPASPSPSATPRHQ